MVVHSGGWCLAVRASNQIRPDGDWSIWFTGSVHFPAMAALEQAHRDSGHGGDHVYMENWSSDFPTQSEAEL